MKKKGSRSALPELEDVEDVETPSTTVLYGKQGSGKTTLACDWPKPLLLLDIRDRGTDSVRDVKKVKVARINDLDSFEAAYWELANGSWGKQFKTVVIDTVTMLQELAIQDVTGSKKAMQWGSLSRKQFGDVAAQMKRYLVDFRDLDMNVVFLAQQRFFNIESEDDEVNEELAPEIGPALMPSIATVMNAAVNIVGQTFIRNKVTKEKVDKKIIRKEKQQYCLYVGPNPVRMTKIRKPKKVVPPSFLVDPTYEDLMEIVKGNE